MALITAISEDFENGADGIPLDATSAIFTAISGTAPDAVFSQDPYQGELAMLNGGTAGALKTYRVDYTAIPSGWFGFAIRLVSIPTAITTVYQHYSNTTLAFSVRITTLGEVQLRDGTTTRFTSPAITVGEWYWVSVHFVPGSATGARLKVYNRATTNVYDSTDGAATSTTATQMDNMRVGIVAGTGDASFVLDHLRTDDSTEIAPLPDPASNVTVTLGASPASPGALDVVTLQATATGGTGPYTYAWSQLSGTSVSLSGSGSSRTFTAPALINASDTLTFECTATPTSGVAGVENTAIIVLEHNFWTMHGGTLVPRIIKTRVGGILKS